MSRRLTRVLVVDDSPVVCRVLADFLQSVPDLVVVGAARSLADARRMVRAFRPDVVTLDLELGGSDGLVLLQEIVVSQRTAVVVVTGASRKAEELTRRALALGASGFLQKFQPGRDLDPEELRRDLIGRVREAARGPRGLPSASRAGGLGAIVIGASTGGPSALRKVLRGLPADFGFGIVLIQHLAPRFTALLAEMLSGETLLKVKEAEAGDHVLPGVVLVAPGGRHLLFAGSGRIELHDGPSVAGHRPSIDVTMQSAADAFGASVVGVLLSGVGADGTLGMAAIRARGGRTLAQEFSTCAEDSMPRGAVAFGAVETVASPARLAELLREAAAEPAAAGG